MYKVERENTWLYTKKNFCCKEQFELCFIHLDFVSQKAILDVPKHASYEDYNAAYADK